MTAVSPSYEVLCQRVEELTTALAVALERATRDEAQRIQYQSIVDHIPATIYRCRADSDYTTVFVGGRIPLLHGTQAAALLAEARVAFARVIHPDDLSRVRDTIDRQLLDARAFDLEYRLVLEGEEVCWVSDRGCLFDGEAGEPSYLDGMLLDITARKRAELQMLEMAYHDPLTGLANRALFKDRLGLALARAKREQTLVAAGLLDLDRFKEVNDAFGHDMGDQLLRAVADRLEALLRESDTLARFGGDEFLLLLGDLETIKAVQSAADKIIACFKRPFRVNGREIAITTSMGLALYPNHGRDAEGLIKRADQAMYAAKRAGRDRWSMFAETPVMDQAESPLQDRARRAL